jgi:hypothetical protein
MKVLGSDAVFIGSAKVLNNPVDTYKDMLEKSPRMRDRFKSNQERLVKSWEQLDLNNDWISTAREKTQKGAFLFIQLLGQNRVDTIVWTSAYLKGKRKNMSESQAIAFADDAVEKTQGSSAISTLSNLQYGDDFKKLLTQISSVPIVNANIEYEATEREQTTLGRMRAKAVAAAFLIAMPVFFDQQVNQLLDWGDDEEDEDKDPDEITKENQEAMMLKMATTGLENQLPVLGRIPSLALALMGGQYATGIIPATDLLVGNTKRAVQGAKAYRAGADMTASEYAAYMNLATLLTGLPFSAAGRVLRFSEDVMTPAEEKLDASGERRELLKEYRESKE